VQPIEISEVRDRLDEFVQEVDEFVQEVFDRFRGRISAARVACICRG